MDENCYQKKCYNMMLLDDQNGNENWVTSVRKCLPQTCFNIWINQFVGNEMHFMTLFVNRLKPKIYKRCLSL